MRGNDTPYNLICGHAALIFCFIIIGVISGCATSGSIQNPDLKPASLPNYIEGTTFVYSDRSWETVQEVTPDSVTWVNHRGRISIGTHDFTHRPSKWKSRTQRGQREFTPVKSALNQLNETLWPLRKGNAVRFNESSFRVHKDGTQKSYRSEWTCKVGGTERVSVLAGQFDTWKIACTRWSIPSRSERISRARETKTWYYAPQVGHFVLRKNVYHTRKPPRKLELLAVIPPHNRLPSKARQRLDQSLAEALEHKKSGQFLQWSLPDAGISAIVTPTSSFENFNNSFCRRYEQKVTVHKQTKTYYGMACRDSNGTWEIPRRRSR